MGSLVVSWIRPDSLLLVTGYLLITLEQPFSICGTCTTGGTRAPSSGTRSMNDFLKQFFEVEASVKKKVNVPIICMILNLH